MLDKLQCLQELLALLIPAYTVQHTEQRVRPQANCPHAEPQLEACLLLQQD
jgi:hypothetical protein